MDIRGGDPLVPARLAPGGTKKTREHIVPQWLQRGFSRSVAPKGVKVAVYRKDSTPLWTNTANVGVRKSFFTSTHFDGDKTATELDGEFASVVKDLRNASGVLEGKVAVDARRLFAHLEVRQGSTERLLRSMQANVFPAALAEQRKKGKLEAWLENPVPSWRDDKGDIEKRCLRRLRASRGRRKTGPVDVRRMVQLVQMSIGSFRELVTAGIAASGASPEEMVEDFVRRVTSEEVVEDAMIFNRSKEMLLRGDAKSRVNGYAGFEWRVIHLSEDVILPDSMVFHETTDSPLVQDFLHVPRYHAASYLPISSRAVLVGKSKRSKGLRRSAGQIRYRAAQASFEFFVAAVKDPLYDNLTEVIGSHRKFASAADWRVVARECVAQ